MFAASATDSRPALPRSLAHGANASPDEASGHEPAGGFAAIGAGPALDRDHFVELMMPGVDSSAAKCSARRGVRFDCSRRQPRVVVATPWPTRHGWNSGPPQICSPSAGRASAIGAVTGRPQRTEYVSIAARATAAAGPATTIGRRSLIRW